MKHAVVGLLALACVGCASAPPPRDVQAELPALESRIFELINDQRHAVDPNARQLSLDSELVGVARQRSTDMAARNAYSDASGDPHVSATRLMSEDAQFQGLLGENVAAQRYSKSKGIDVDQYAMRIVASWMASPSHKENLIFADYARTGVGAALNADTIFITQLFATQATFKPASAKPPIRPAPHANGASSDRAGNVPQLRGAIGNP
jgi:uncharacterized protein YkwD